MDAPTGLTTDTIATVAVTLGILVTLFVWFAVSAAQLWWRDRQARLRWEASAARVAAFGREGIR